MQATVYIIYDRKGVLRMTKGPPSLALGERFTAIRLVAPDSLWAEPKVEPKTILVPEGASLAPPTEVSLADVPNVCFGPLLPASVDQRRSYICSRCGFESHQMGDSPHWKWQPEDPAKEAKHAE